MVGKKSNKRKLFAYNKALGLFSLLLMLKKSISGNLESMASTYAKICWIVAYFSTLFLISKKKTFSGLKIVTLILISLSISVLPEVFDLFDMMQNSRKHLPCPVYKNAIKSPYEVTRTLYIKHTIWRIFIRLGGTKDILGYLFKSRKQIFVTEHSLGKNLMTLVSERILRRTLF